MVVGVKSGCFAHPLVLDARELHQWLIQIGRSGGDGRGGRGGDGRGIPGGKRATRDGRLGVGRKDPRVVDLADDPFLNSDNVRRSRYLRWFAILEPRVGESARRVSNRGGLRDSQPAYRPADMVGQSISLQTARPRVVSTSWITWIIPVSNLFISTTTSGQPSAP